MLRCRQTRLSCGPGVSGDGGGVGWEWGVWGRPRAGAWWGWRPRRERPGTGVWRGFGQRRGAAPAHRAPGEPVGLRAHSAAAAAGPGVQPRAGVEPGALARWTRLHRPHRPQGAELGPPSQDVEAGGRGLEGAGAVGQWSPTWGTAGEPTDSEARRRAGREREAGAFGLEEPGELEPPQTQEQARGTGPRPLEGAGDQPGQFLGAGGRRDVGDVMGREEREPRKEPTIEGQTPGWWGRWVGRATRSGRCVRFREEARCTRRLWAESASEWSQSLGERPGGGRGRGRDDIQEQGI